LKIRLFLLFLGIGATLCFPAASSVAGESAELHDLTFRPKEGQTYTVEYENDSTWHYPKDKMKGTLRTTLKLGWKILPPQAKGKSRAKAEYLSVAYVGEGEKFAKPFNYDLLWTREKGYVRGEDEDANRRWIRREIHEGLLFTFDPRGLTDPGAG
jgi:hypothetical protein